MESMTVKEIVRDYLEKNSYDGLCYEGCGCGLDDFMLCREVDIQECKSAYKHKDGLFWQAKEVTQ